MITCLHTAEVHVATFGGLIPRSNHVVREDLLQRAREGGVDAVQKDVAELLGDLARSGPVLCTCSTLGPIVDAVGLDNVVRIDRPAMEQVAGLSDRVCIAICLNSTRSATLSLFEEVAGGQSKAELVMCERAWPYFERGDLDGFAREIVTCLEDVDVPILLAQASMTVAAERLRSRGLVVYTTPEAAAQAVMKLDALR